MIFATMGAGIIIGPIEGGYLADAIGRKRTIVISLFRSAQGNLGIFFMAFGFCQVFSVLALSPRDEGLTSGQYSLIMSLNGLLILLVELPVTHYLKRFRPKYVLAVGFALIGLGLSAFDRLMAGRLSTKAEIAPYTRPFFSEMEGLISSVEIQAKLWTDRIGPSILNRHP